ncbi:hypothetical protein ACQR06_23470 [Bradyrhizobium sp. HKCCYLRH1065]|uniref:hypothetical protein n=1 Tax=Bradyrhizobium sp. HKCCYLRH1065 TaxID=3420753 RepID=UPI003EBE5F2B
MTAHGDFGSVIEQAQHDALHTEPLRLAATLAFTSAKLVGNDPIARTVLRGVLLGLAKELSEGASNAVETRQ